MGKYANKPLTAAVAWSLTTLLVGLNALLLADFF
jgi:Mn2+/Fe2+ NRAMP family transporter